MPPRLARVGAVWNMWPELGTACSVGPGFDQPGWVPHAARAGTLRGVWVNSETQGQDWG